MVSLCGWGRGENWMGKFPVTADVSGTRCTPPLRELLAASGCHGYELSGSLPTHASLWRSVISGRKEHWFQHNWGLSTLLTTSLYSDPIKTLFDGVFINPHTFLKEDSLCEVFLLQSLRLFSLHQPPRSPWLASGAPPQLPAGPCPCSGRTCARGGELGC